MPDYYDRNARKADRHGLWNRDAGEPLLPNLGRGNRERRDRKLRISDDCVCDECPPLNRLYKAGASLTLRDPSSGSVLAAMDDCRSISHRQNLTLR